MINFNHNHNKTIKINIASNKLSKYIKIDKNNKINIIPNPIVSSVFFSILSPRFNLVLEKTKNYKFRHTKLNYLRISNCEIKNSYFFSNTNYNFVDYSLKNNVFLVKTTAVLEGFEKGWVTNSKIKIFSYIFTKKNSLLLLYNRESKNLHLFFIKIKNILLKKSIVFGTFLHSRHIFNYIVDIVENLIFGGVKNV